MATVLGILACLSFALFSWQFFLGVRFCSRQRQEADVPQVPNPPPHVGGYSFPGLTILKPLKGFDSETEGCLRTWLEQDYPGPVQILFGVASEHDPALKLVRQTFKTEVIVCPKDLGANPKLSTLAQLEPLIQHDLIIISDADVAVPRDFLRRIARFFESQQPAVASCLYRLSGAVNLPMRMEAFMINSDFWSQVLQSIALKPMNFALGAAMVITRSELATLGGFRALVDYLADDYQLGNRATGKVALCPIVVECRSSQMAWREVFAHQLRWARTIRVCQPLPFFFSILSIPTVWLAGWALIGAPVPALTMLALRCIGGAWLEGRFTGAFYASSVFLALLTDLLRSTLWFLAFSGNSINWGGKAFRVLHGGKLTPDQEQE